MSEQPRDGVTVHDETVAMIAAAVDAATATSDAQMQQAEQFLSGGLDTDITFGPAHAPST